MLKWRKGGRVAEAALRGGKRSSGDFRKRLHKRAHLNFSNSPAFHFPDGRSFVRDDAFASHARFFCRFLSPSGMAAASVETFEKSSPHRRTVFHPPMFYSSLFCFFRHGKPPVRRRELSQCERGLKLSSYIRSLAVHLSPGLSFRAGLSTVSGEFGIGPRCLV